jgi:hypothetical protein
VSLSYHFIAAYRHFPREGLRKFKGNFKSTERLKASPPFPDGVKVITCSSSLELSRQIHAQCLLLHAPHSPGHGIPLPPGNVFIQWTRAPSPGPSPTLTDVDDEPLVWHECEVDERPGLTDDEAELAEGPRRKVVEMRANSEELFTDDDEDDVPLMASVSRAPRRRQVASDDEGPSNAQDTRESAGASSAKGEEGSQAGENGDTQEEAWWLMDTGDVFRDA